MAKGKHATALFEVMSKARLNGQKAGTPSPGGGIPTPKWWFKSKSKGDVRTIPPAEPVNDAAEESAVDGAEGAEGGAPVMSAPLVSSMDVNEVSPSLTGPRVQPVAVSVDREKQQISLRLTYTSALIGGFGLVIAIALAVIIGKSMSRGPQTAIAGTSTQQLKQSPPVPGVMSVQRRPDAAAQGANDAVEGNTTRNTNSTASTGTRNPQQNFNDPRPPATFFTDDPRRQNGLNYAIIQSYPDRDTAEKAAEFLTKNGIPCTVEKDLPNWRLPWADGCCVVGIRGFAKVLNNPALEAYKKSIMDVSAKFTNGRSRFAAFAPSMYLWKKSN